MTNGSTAASISPVVQENDMSKIREIFERAASAIAQASDLAKTVNELQHIVDGLKADVEKTRQNNSFLDEALSNTRRSRDEALAEASELRHKLSQSTSELEIAKDQVCILSNDRDKANEKLHQAESDRDNALLEAMQVREDLEKAQAQLKAIKSSLGIVDQPKPEPVAVAQPEPTPPQAIPMPAPEHHEYTQPSPTGWAEPSYPKRVYENETAFSWDKPNYYDNEKHLYYNEG